MKPSRHKASGRWCIRIPPRLSDSGRWGIKYFSSEAKAREAIKAIQAEKSEHGRQSVTATERHWINVARTELGSLEKLREVLDHWRRSGAGVHPVSATDAVEQFIAHRTSDKLNPETKRDISWRLHAFSKEFGDAPIHSITAGELERWLQGYTEGWARHSMFKRVRPMFAYGKRNHWLLANPFDDLEPPDTPGGRKDVYTPKQYHDLLMTAVYTDEEVSYFLALAGMAFLRTQELVRRFKDEPVLEWRDFLWDRNPPEIRIREEVGKSTRRKSGNERFTPMHRELRTWLAVARAEEYEGRVIEASVRSFRKRLLAVFDEAKVPFLPNALRHSAISYWLAANPEFGVAQVSQWAGNSESSCRRHYLKVLTKADGLRWFETARG
jgi:hypothetical protein